MKTIELKTGNGMAVVTVTTLRALANELYAGAEIVEDYLPTKRGFNKVYAMQAFGFTGDFSPARKLAEKLLTELREHHDKVIKFV